MTDPLILLKPGETWLIEQWLEKLSAVLESMTDEKPSLTWSLEGADKLGENALLMEQKLDPAPDPALWIGLPGETWKDLGRRVLMAAGVEEVSDEESRNTTLEIVQQAVGGLAQVLTTRLEREVTRGASHDAPFFPEGLAIVRVTLQYGETFLPPLWIALAPFLNTWLDAKTSEAAAPPPTPTPAAAPLSKTFDLLLDVAMPVSVSFGRSSLAIKEVLKLTTGSIVELNREVSEPVDVIVNNCVIARGEVVVVEGNYGVRIQQIVSRQERLTVGRS